MTTRASLSIFCSLLLLILHPTGTAGETGNRPMTQDQALSILRSQLANPPGVGFFTVREIEASPDTWRAAQVSLDEAHQQHLALYGDGVLLDLMRTGGFAVVEFNETSGITTRLHLVTLDEAGKPVVRSHDVHGELTKSETLMLLDRNTAFSDVFFAPDGSEMKQLADDFGEAGIGSLGAPDGQGYFAVPEAIRKLTTRPEELSDLAGLFSILTLWPARYSLTSPVYAASPVDAVTQARNQQLKLVKDFLAEKGKGVKFFFDLMDLNSIRTHEELLDRVQWLREIVSFLNEHSPLNVGSTTYRANVFVSSIPLDIVAEQDTERFYGVMTAPGVVSIWSRDAKGDFFLKGIGEGE